MRGRPDEDESRGVDRLGELGVLGQEAVARVDRVGAGDLGGGDDAGHHQVALTRRAGPDADVVVGEADVQRVAVGGGVHRHRLDAEFLAGTDDAKGDLAAVRDQDFLDHQAVNPSIPPPGADLPVSLEKVRSDAEPMPEARSANSLGLLA